MRSESEFLADIVSRLNAAGVDYMLTGSMASNYWGIPRTTHDVDIVLTMRPNQVDALVASLSPGFFIQPDSVRSAFRPPHHFNVMDDQSAIKADFWLLRDLAFDQSAFKRRVSVSLFGAPTWIATAEDIILHKLYWNSLTPSERQLGDAAGVFAVQMNALDVGYLRRWAGELGVDPELTAIFEGRIKPKST
ncbi:MAG: hypothetical protein ACOY3P_06380 [Planctomycetota bacterium]